MKFMRKNGGFTLVELIVVIAILAILAGVAVPAYSGYINKANEAADNQLLAAVNTAFAAACIENNVAPASVTDASIQVSGKKIVAVTSVSAPEGNTAGVPNSFAAYFTKANPNASFKVFEALGYNKDTHNFEGAATIKAGLGGGLVTMNSTDLNNLANSSFGKDIPGTLLLVDDVSSLVGGLVSGSNALSAATSNEAFLDSVLMTMGLTPEKIAEMPLTDKMAAATAQNEKLIAQMVEKGMTPDQAKAQVQGNALVLYAAQQTGKMNKNEMKEFLASANGETLNVVIGNMTDDKKSGEGVAQAALLCGMYASYLKQDEDPTNDNDVTADKVMTALDTKEFQDFLADSSKYEADLDGYVSSLNMVNSSAQDLDAVEHLMINGFAGSGLEEIISGALNGK